MTEIPKDMTCEKCINHYIGGSCNNVANPNNIILDGCGRPLVYCDECWNK